jgi:SAM-dependent methyltransferase
VPGSAPIDPQLADVATVLRCLACGQSAFAVAPEALTCGRCGHVVPVIGGIPHIRDADEAEAVSRERETVRELDQAPLLRPTDFSLASLVADRGALLDAFSSLPYDDGSVFFRENQYFKDVAKFADVFDYAAGQLGPGHGGRLLDVGADLTWSTARLAARGWRPVGIDINHHLAAAHALRRRGPAYAVVNADMHLPVFREGTFDAIAAFNALHHTHRVEALIGTLAATLRPGGRLCVVEPYWFLEEVRQAFGVSAIEAGINENVYRLEEWHRWFVQAGLELETFLISHSYNAVYVKRLAGVPARTISLADAEAELFDRFYHAELVVTSEIPNPVPAGTTLVLPVTIVNHARAGWSSEGQIPIRASYHLARIERDGGRTQLAFGQSRTPFAGHLLPGERREVRITIAVPDQPGEYEVSIDLVHELRMWFSERGSTLPTVRLHVVEPTE